MTDQFDIASKTYDSDFTNSSTGRLQRDLVWKYLDERLEQMDRHLNVLELNCGTGEDAMRLAKAGHNVIATDLSEAMLARTKDKITRNRLSHKVHIEKANLTDLNANEWDIPFDLIFSNFGGVNCISGQDLEKFKSAAKNLLKPNGLLIMVIMPEFCAWESWYFLAKLKFNDVFRRKKESVLADVSGKQVQTWYYSPKKLNRLFSPEFLKVKLRPIGFFAPPSYMEAFARRNKRVFRFISFLEKRFSRYAWQGSLSDHFYIEFKAK